MWVAGSGSVLRSAVLVLLLVSCCKGCDYENILSVYRTIILVDLQNLSLPDSGDNSRVRDPCTSGKASHISIVRSIYSLTQQSKCIMPEELLPGTVEHQLMKPVQDMEQLLKERSHCRLPSKAAGCKRAPGKKRRGKKRRLQQLRRTLRQLTTCWQKLQSAYALSH